MSYVQIGRWSNLAKSCGGMWMSIILPMHHQPVCCSSLTRIKYRAHYNMCRQGPLEIIMWYTAAICGLCHSISHIMWMSQISCWLLIQAGKVQMRMFMDPVQSDMHCKRKYCKWIKCTIRKKDVKNCESHTYYTPWHIHTHARTRTNRPTEQESLFSIPSIVAEKNGNLLVIFCSFFSAHRFSKAPWQTFWLFVLSQGSLAPV